MKRDKIQTGPAKTHRPVETNITHQPRGTSGVVPPETSDGGLLRWLALASLVAVGAGALLLFMSPGLGSKVLRHPLEAARSFASRDLESKPWEPLSEEDRLIDRFVTLHKAGDKAALDLLGPAPVFDDEPVSEKTAESRQTDFYLRSDLQFRDIRRGEPDGNGGRRAVPGRYTIVTKGSVSSPKLNIRTERGIEREAQEHLTSPDLVVEVREGKIYGLRAELPMGR
jgi:hypothetical protein